MNISEKSKLNTLNFLRSYAIQKAMSEVSVPDEALDVAPVRNDASAGVRPFDIELKCGQIRLLADVNRLTYIVLLKEWGDNAFVTTAFSHYDFPATDEEFALERNYGAYLNVLQVWNTRTLRDEILKRSWVCGTLSESVRRTVWDFWLSLSAGKELPIQIRERSGVPIESRNDVRLEYMREEAEVFAVIEAADLNDAEAGNKLNSWFNDNLILPPLWQPEELVLAAGDEKQNIRLKCVVDGRPEILALQYSQSEKKVWIRVFSPAMERSDALDGAGIVDAAQKTLAVIAGDRCEFPAPDGFDGAVAVRTADGAIRTLSVLP